MAETFKRLAGLVANTATPVGPAHLAYTAPSGVGSSTIIKGVRIVNTSSTTSATIKLWHHSIALATPGDASNILPATTIDAGGFAEFDGTITMGVSEALFAQGSAATITLTIYGVEITA
jgi:hypothetical protein